MKTRNKLHIINKSIMLICIVVFSTLSSFAAENALLGIDVKQNQDKAYDIMLKLDKNAQIQKTIGEDGNLIININGALPADSMDIIYDNASDLNNVIVQKKNKDNTIILLQGTNIENSKIFTKELSTGITKQLDSKTNLLSNILFIADKKILAGALGAMMLFFLFMLALRPKEKRYNASYVNKLNKTHKNIKANTLRNKNLVQSKNIPSINYNINNGFNSAVVSMPNDFVINNYNTQEEEIRKAG